MRANAELISVSTNAIIRGLSLVTRLLVTILLASALGPADFGIFTLIQTTIIISILCLGFEFNAYSRREIVLEKDPVKQACHIRNQLAIAGVLGMLAPLVAYGAAFTGIYAIRLAGLVTMLIFFELISQEGIRILYALQRMTAANIVYFVRSSMWLFVLAPMYMWSPQTVTLCNTLSTWAVFEVAALTLLAWTLRRHDWNAVRAVPIDWQWIWRGFAIALPFFVGTLFINMLSYAPRFILFYIRGAHETGIFGLYTSITAGIVNLISTITVPPGIARAVSDLAYEGEAAFSAQMRKLWLHSFVLTAFLAACLLVLFPILLPFVGAKYPMDWWLLLFVILANTAQVASIVAQIPLYARHRDKDILAGTAISGTLSIGLQYTLTDIAGMHGLALAMALSFTALMVFYFIFEWRARRSQPA